MNAQHCLKGLSVFALMGQKRQETRLEFGCKFLGNRFPSSLFERQGNKIEKQAWFDNILIGTLTNVLKQWRKLWLDSHTDLKEEKNMA